MTGKIDEYEHEASKEKYSTRFRICKTVQLIATWISFGITCEILGPTLEDLKIYLNTDYNMLTFLISLKQYSYLAITLLGGVLFDRFAFYAESIMCLAALLLVAPNILLTVNKSAWLIGLGFIIQGFGHAFYDIGGNQIILRLWKGISDSPVNAMHAGYGIGAMIAVQIVKPFIQFDPQQQIANLTETTTVAPDAPVNLKFRIPYWISVLIGVIVAILFVFAQLFEIGNKNKYLLKNRTNRSRIIQPDDENDQSIELITKNAKPVNNSWLVRLFFGNVNYQKPALVYAFTQIGLILIVMLFMSGYSAVISRFTLPYLTLGPAKFSVPQYIQAQSIFWIAFVCARFLAAIIAFKLNPLLFMFGLLLINLTASLLLVIPNISDSELFYYVVFAVQGVTSGPGIPSMYMVAKHVLRNYNSFVLSIFALGLGAGPLIFQQSIGYILDSLPDKDHFLGFSNFNSKFLIAHLIFISTLFSFFIFVLIALLYKKFGRLVKSF